MRNHKIITVKARVSLGIYLDTDDGRTLCCPNLQDWIPEGTYGYFQLKETENPGNYKVISCLKSK